MALEDVGYLYVSLVLAVLVWSIAVACGETGCIIDWRKACKDLGALCSWVKRKAAQLRRPLGRR